ncbi:MAG: DUF393 domain-containing protein [Phycisphaerales bacterium]|nr:DUF393 domain-containing protein [Phycisphaerales bacterium]
MTNNAQSVVVYDGQCQFCINQIARIRAWDKRECFEYTPRETPGLDERFPKLAEGDFNTGMRLITPEGQIHVGADAVYEIARQLPGWGMLAWLYRVPGIHALSRWAYAWVAAHRKSLGRTCEGGACRIDQGRPTSVDSKSA